MALKELKTHAKELTTPRVTQDGLPYTRPSRLAFAANDPIAEILAAKELKGSPDIDNSGRGLLRVRNHAFEINDIYQNSQEKEQEEREHNGGLTDFEVFQNTVLTLNNIYYPVTSPSVTLVASGYSVGKSHIGNDGNKYTAIHDETGRVAYYDNGTMCVANKGGLSPTTPPMVNDDLIDDSQKFNITYKIDKDGNQVERTPEEADFALIMTRIDNRHTKLPLQLNAIDRMIADATGATRFSSTVPSGITAEIAPSDPFAAAVSATGAPAAEKSIMFKTSRAPASWERIERPEKATPALEPSL